MLTSSIFLFRIEATLKGACMKPHLKSIKSHIIGVTVVFTLLLTLFITTFVYVLFSRLLSESLVQSTNYNLSLASEAISKDLLPITSFASWCESNIELAKYIEAADKMNQAALDYSAAPSLETKTIYENERNAVRQQSLISWKRLLEEYRNNRSSLYINRIVVSNFEGNYLQISPISSYHALDIFETITNFQAFEKQLTSKSPFWSGIEYDPFGGTPDAQMIPLIRPVYAPYTNDIIGWSYLSISPQIITDIFSVYELPTDSQLFITINQRTYEVTKEQLLPHQWTDIDFDQQIQPFVDSDGQNRTLITYPSSINGWYLSQTLSTQQLSTQKNIYILLLIVIAFIVMLLGFLLTIFLNYKINKPLTQLLSKLKSIASGDFSYDARIEWNNELGEIGRGINNLSENIVLLMDRRIEDEKEKNQLEYEILQSQINPHFLYNTLNSIKWMASIQHATGIAEMTTSLSKLLRSVSKDTHQIHTLSDEIELLDHYFLIQKYRYGGMLTLTYIIDTPDIYQCQLPKFTLQPIVENAIFHGIEPKQSTGAIQIHAFFPSETILQIDISDDGVGMTRDQIKDLLSNSRKHQHDFFKRIGINNVNLRIQHAYGQDFGLTITSSPASISPHSGTTVHIRLPIRRLP